MVFVRRRRTPVNCAEESLASAAVESHFSNARRSAPPVVSVLVLVRLGLYFPREMSATRRRKTPLHASQSSAARLGRATGTLALEQLPRLLPGRDGTRNNKRVGGSDDEDAHSGGVRSPWG